MAQLIFGETKGPSVMLIFAYLIAIFDPCHDLGACEM